MCIRDSTETVLHLAALLSGDWARAEATAPHHAAEASRLVTLYVQWHLERHVKSFTVLENA